MRTESAGHASSFDCAAQQPIARGETTGSMWGDALSRTRMFFDSLSAPCGCFAVMPGRSELAHGAEFEGEANIERRIGIQMQQVIPPLPGVSANNQ
jgi:hypothetical protein